MESPFTNVPCTVKLHQSTSCISTERYVEAEIEFFQNAYNNALFRVPVLLRYDCSLHTRLTGFQQGIDTIQLLIVVAREGEHCRWKRSKTRRVVAEKLQDFPFPAHNKNSSNSPITRVPALLHTHASHAIIGHRMVSSECLEAHGWLDNISSVRMRRSCPATIARPSEDFLQWRDAILASWSARVLQRARSQCTSQGIDLGERSP